MTTIPVTDLPTIADRITELEGVIRASAWTRVEGRERIYVDLDKCNGGRRWNGGIGHRVIVHAADGRVELAPGVDWAGAATRDWHERLGTIERIQAIVAEAISPTA